MRIDYPKLLIAIFLCELAGVIGSLFTFSSIPNWYAALVRPSFSPPNWLFAPVWTALYALMGIAVYLVYMHKKKPRNAALLAFGAQLLLNMLWSVVFFGWNSIQGGLIVILLLWLAIIWTIMKFYPIDRFSAYLLVPYLLWVSFAAVLNYYIFILN